MDVGYYKYRFSRLHTAKLKGKQAPHKAVLLIAVMRLVARGVVCSPEIELTEELVKTYKEVWAEKVPASCPFSCSIGQPFFHMQHEPFWRLLEHGEAYDMMTDELGLYDNLTKDMPNGYSVGAIRRKFRCAVIEKQLYDVICDAENRRVLEELLTIKYLNYNSPFDNRKVVAAAIGASLLFVA